MSSMSAKLLNVQAGAVTVQQHTLIVRSADPVTNHSLPWSNAMQRTHLCSSTCAHQFQSPSLRGAPQLRANCCRGVRASARSPADVVQLSVQSTVGRCPLQKTENTRHAVHMCCLKDSHPRWPAITRYSFQGACHTGRGHLLGMRRATAAEGRYSSLPPPALGTTAPPPVCSTIACAFCRAAAAALHDIIGRVDAAYVKDACCLSSRPTFPAGLALTGPATG